MIMSLTHPQSIELIYAISLDAQDKICIMLLHNYRAGPRKVLKKDQQDKGTCHYEATPYKVDM